MSMNECLKALRVENGLTQQQLAQILNVSNKNIWTYEKGIAIPPPVVLIGYAKYFNVSLDFIFGLEDDLGSRTAEKNVPQLNAEEQKIILDYRQLNSACQKLVQDTINTLLTSSGAAQAKNKKLL